MHVKDPSNHHLIIKIVYSYTRTIVQKQTKEKQNTFSLQIQPVEWNYYSLYFWGALS